MPLQINTRYVTRNPQILSGEPIIIGTKTSVRAIVGLWRLGTSPEEIPIHLPHLTLAQVFDALSFYQDNQTEINDYIKRNHIPDELVHPAIKSRWLFENPEALASVKQGLKESAAGETHYLGSFAQYADLEIDD